MMTDSFVLPVFVELPLKVASTLPENVLLNVAHIMVLREHFMEYPTLRLADDTRYTIKLTYGEVQQRIEQATSSVTNAQEE